MRAYRILDVFTDQALAGNPLAVVLDTDGLNSEDMGAIAAEFNLSETVFVRPPKHTDHRANLRIFTPKKEIPFAGHPTIGTAILLAHMDGIKDGQTRQFILAEAVGAINCQVTRTGDSYKAQFELSVLPTYQAVDLDKDVLAQALGLEQSDIGLDDQPMSVCDAGVPYPIIPLNGLEAMANITINDQALADCMGEIGRLAEVFVYTQDCVHGESDYHVRMFSPAFGITEDPATGSAAAALAAHIMRIETLADGTHSRIIEQGLEMGRPSRIELSLKVKGGTLVSASIGGQAIIVAEGHLHI